MRNYDGKKQKTYEEYACERQAPIEKAIGRYYLVRYRVCLKDCPGLVVVVRAVFCQPIDMGSQMPLSSCVKLQEL